MNGILTRAGCRQWYAVLEIDTDRQVYLGQSATAAERVWTADTRHGRGDTKQEAQARAAEATAAARQATGSQLAAA